ncbi:MAG: chorismate synthase [Muribaculaceae bacterium]|nr:chorismate synthase [Muribaculaceae bacterium]
MNTFGKNLTLTTFGESHGPAMGGIIDGFPAGYKINFERLLAEVAKRRPGQSVLVTARKETDTPEFLSGISPDGITLGTPIGFIVRNADHHSSDYDEMAKAYRPSHADYTYIARYGLRDHRGGGRQSARETVNWVVAGALASQWLESKGISIEAVLSQVGPITAGDLFDGLMTEPEKPFRLEVNPDLRLAMEEFVKETKKAGDSVGGKVSCMITGLPAGIGSPVADKLHSRLAAAMMSINAAKGFEYGMGFRASSAMGSKVNDPFLPSSAPGEPLKTATNFSGGIQGGISNGMPVFFSVAFKPTPTLMIPQDTVDTQGNHITLNPAGRHDPCVAVRAVPVVKAMAGLVVADFLV